MKTHFSNADIQQLKNHLGRLLPNVKSSHRVEAMARGLGFNSNAALRHQLSISRIHVYPSDYGFYNYLKEHGFPDEKYSTLSEAVILSIYPDQRNHVQVVMDQHPQVSHFGIGVYNSYGKKRSEIEKELAASRASMLSSEAVMEFMKACEYLSQFGKRKTINYRASSYGLKHSAEKYLKEKHEDISGYDPYVANGMFIAAAIHLGFDYKADGPNLLFNISSKPIPKIPLTAKSKKLKKKSMRLAGHTGGKLKTKAWRNMMVAAINAGLDQGIFGLKEDENHWGEGTHVFHFKFGHRKAIASVSDAGFGELSVHVAVNPTKRAAENIKSCNSGLYAGDAFVSGYLERRNGAWLQTSKHPCNAIRRELLHDIVGCV